MSDWNIVNESSIFLRKSGNLRVLYPPKKIKRTIASFHPKIMLIRFKDKLRVVVGSANASSGDWMFWSNCFVKIDCPKLDSFLPKSLLAFDAEKEKQKINDRKACAKNLDEHKTEKNDLELENEEFNKSVAKYRKTLIELGYSFGGYLREYLKWTMGDTHEQLKSFLQIDLDEFDLRQPNLFLVGSLPGAFPNELNYSSPELLQLGRFY